MRRSKIDVSKQEGKMAGLFDTINIKGLKLKNRIVMPPMFMGMATPEGAPTDRHIKHYTDRARGGVGLIIVEHTYVQPNGKAHSGQLGLYDDKLIPTFKHLTDAVHSEGARIVIQLNHAGARTTQEVIGEQPVAPWNIPLPGNKEIPRPLTIPEMKTIAKAFGEAARRALEAGFDAVEVHGAHAFLLCQFVSPYTNQRNDAYGGSTEGRIRFPLEVISEVKKKAGKKRPIILSLRCQRYGRRWPHS